MATQTVPHVFTSSKPAVAIPIPQSSPETVTQYELVEVILLRNTLRQRQERPAGIEAGLKARLEADVHVAELKEVFRRNVAWREVSEQLAGRLFGEGRGAVYCDQVLGGTPPGRTVSLVIR